jgi:hypothetical protein
MWKRFRHQSPAYYLTATAIILLVSACLIAVFEHGLGWQAATAVLIGIVLLVLANGRRRLEVGTNAIRLGRLV